MFAELTLERLQARALVVDGEPQLPTRDLEHVDGVVGPVEGRLEMADPQLEVVG